MTDLKLLALDKDDLAVVSAHVQDAVVRVADMGFAKGDQRFALLINRYDWESGTVRNKGLRKRAALHFDRVLSVASAGIDTNARDGVLELLTIGFAETDAPAGTVELTFAGGGTIRLVVECLEVRLEDLGAAWAAKAQPRHAL